MNKGIKLKRKAGGYAKLPLPEPGQFESLYVFSMEHCGALQFWQLLERLMAAAGRPVCAVHEGLGEGGLRQNGGGFGIFFEVDPALKEIVVGESHKLLFLRDPRTLLVAAALHAGHFPVPAAMTPGLAPAEQAARAAKSGSSPFAKFLQSPAAERVAQRYRDYAEVWRRERNVTLLRYEYAVSGWHAIAAEIAATLKLAIDPLRVASIAADAPPLGDRLPGRGSPPAGSPFWMEIAQLEARLADVLAAFGYTPRLELDHRPGPTPVRSNDNAPEGTRILPPLSAIYERDPVLWARLKPNSSTQMEVLGRRVILNVDAMGCRPVIGQPAEGEKTLAAYGCSFTYGHPVAAEETFCSLLQGMFPAWRVENHGVPGYGTAQNLIQLERETRWNKAGLVTFCWIEHHLRRNVADFSWIERLSWSALSEGPGRRVPRATLDQNGALQMQSVRLPRPDFSGIDFSDFAPDNYYLDLVCFRLFERANAIVIGCGGHFFITTLQGQLSTGLRKQLADHGIPVVDASLSGDEYTCLPYDSHPNALANRIYAERIREYLLSYTGGQPARD
jgi:hypothetical protein